MHNGAKYTPDALEAIILGLKEQGYELVPISELIHKENYEMDHEGRQHVKENAGAIEGTGTPAPGNSNTTGTVTPDLAVDPATTPAATPSPQPNTTAKTA